MRAETSRERDEAGKHLANVGHARGRRYHLDVLRGAILLSHARGHVGCDESPDQMMLLKPCACGDVESRVALPR